MYKNAKRQLINITNLLAFLKTGFFLVFLHRKLFDKTMLAEEITNLIDKKGYLLADGATGTNLFDMGLESGYPPELWNQERPDLVSNNHKKFIEAGSDIILTNSFGANKYRLALHNSR